jgi:CRISPR system Cascade subunit CasE
MLDEFDYQLNPDTEPLGWSRLSNAITFEETFIGQSPEQGDEQLDSEETIMTKDRLYMVRGQIDLDALAEYMQYRDEHELDYIMSCLMEECFGRDLIPNTFRTMLGPNNKRPHFLAYGAADAEQMQRAHEHHSGALLGRVIPINGIASKLMPPNWPPGLRVTFAVRVRPTFLAHVEGDLPPAIEVDWYQHTLENCRDDEIPPTREEVYSQWLSEELAKGGAWLDRRTARLLNFSDEVRLHPYRYGFESKGPSGIVTGVLDIVDIAAFNQLLATGIGRHQDRGYGMLLMTPVGWKQ